MMQKEYIGVGTVNMCEDVLGDYQGKNILLVTGKSSYLKSGAKDLLHDILSDFNVTIFSDFSVNPKVEDLKRGVSLFNEIDAGVVIAVGGGSVIDMAKLINYFSANEMGELPPPEPKEGKEKLRPLIAIPTTAGSGSEATHFAVLYKGSQKVSVAYNDILPDVAIVDAGLTASLSKGQIAVSGMDALSQAVESYWSISSTEESKKYAKEAIELILLNIVKAVNERDKGSLVDMAKAAHFAGKAINITRTTAPHALSYPITAFYDVPHGHAVALTLGKCFIINSNLDNAELNETRGERYLTKTMQEIANMFDCESPQSASCKWYDLMSTIGMESDLKLLGIFGRSDIDKIISNVNTERLCNNPVRITKVLLRKIFT